jgi:hypothetical protein
MPEATDIPARIWEGTKWVLKQPLNLMTMDTPKWMYPAFGAAALAPIIGYALSKKKQNVEKAAMLTLYGPETVEYHMQKAATAMDQALARNKAVSEATRPDPEAMLGGLDKAKAMLRNAKRVAAYRRLTADNPEVRMTSKKDQLRKAMPVGDPEYKHRILGQYASS